MSDEKKSWLDKAGAVHLWKTIEAILGTKVDKIEGFGLSSNDYTTEEKKKLASLSDPDVATTENNGLMSSADKAKLDGIEAGANNYTHPVYEAKQAGLYRISVDNTGHVATADKMTSEELATEGVSPADHTHDLGKLVDTLDTSADAVEDADIVMVGSTVTSDDSSATTKYTRRPLATLWNWIKSRTDTLYAAVGHTHKVNELENYNTHVYNPTLNRTKRTVLAAPTGADGPATFRALDKNDVGLGNVDNVAALPLTGGTIIGALNFANNTWNPVGDDVQIGDHNTSGSFYVQGLNGPTNIKLKKNNDTSEGSGDSATITYDGGNLIIDKTIQANLQGTADFANGTLFDKAQWVSLTSLDQNTQYPVVSMNSIPYSGLHHIKCNVQLNSGSKPSWSTHGGGFTVNLDLLVTAFGQGTTYANSICLNNDSNWVTSGANPAGYSQMGNGSVAVFWLRGGGQYRLYADWDADWTVKTSTYTNNDQSVSPTTSYPGVSINRSTITANIDGNATIATTGVRDYNNANNTIKIGWSGADLDANTLAYVAGYTSDMKIHTASKDGVRSWLGNGVSASGQNYVRFDDGTQICWGSCGNNSFSSFGAAFANTDYRIGMSEWKSSSWENYAIGGKSTTGVTLRSEDNTMEYIAIGRWK